MADFGRTEVMTDSKAYVSGFNTASGSLVMLQSDVCCSMVLASHDVEARVTHGDDTASVQQ